MPQRRLKVMKLKLDENGNVAVQDDMPVYVHEDGTELPFDAADAIQKITNLGAEAKNHRLAKEEALEKLELFGDVTPENARKAVETMANLDAKKLIDAGEVDTLKKQMAEIFEEEKKTLVDQASTDKKTYEETIARLTGQLRHHIVTSAFSACPFFSGPEPKTILPPDMAAQYFGQYFKIEGEGPEARLVGYIGDQKIPSRESIGEIANFEEAIAAIIEQYPMKDRILKASSGGSGSEGNFQSGGDGSRIVLNKADSKDPQKYQAAKKKAAEAGVPLILES
jgi:hypothetical protein